MRHKQIIGLNVHGSVKFAVDFALSIVSEKMRNRIKFYTNAELANNVDIALLPKEVIFKKKNSPSFTTCFLTINKPH